MPIVIERVTDGYIADVTPPHGPGTIWRTSHPLPLDALIRALQAIGCHQTDIGDALYTADPGWQETLGTN
jgi:hypothetical protein